MSKSKKTAVVSEDKLHQEYAKYSKENDQKYGSKTMVLLHNGKFFEVYGVQSLETGEYQDSKILEFSEVTQSVISPRPGVMDKFGKVMMAGVPTPQLDKYLQILLDNGYTVCVYGLLVGFVVLVDGLFLRNLIFIFYIFISLYCLLLNN
jgi:DNA mismatch repair ATPase MutS